MNPDKPVARGEVVSELMEGGRRLTWRFHSPQWTANYPFESIIKPNGGGYTLVIRSLPGDCAVVSEERIDETMGRSALTGEYWYGR